jgi:hypothetical protein
MGNIDVYIEAHKRIEAVICGMDMDDFDKISGTDMGIPSDNVIDAMYNLAELHLKETENLELDRFVFKNVHTNLIKPI